MSYKYANVHEWFEQFAREQKENELFAIVIELASKLSADDLQDLFQSEMTEDGYFDSEAQWSRSLGTSCSPCETTRLVGERFDW